MKVKITLYPTTFDKDNIFVGSQSLTRENEIDTFYADTKLELPLSAYNAERPFRIQGNFLLYDRKYNYAKYQLYDNTNADTPLDTRYYFILRYDYVNDNVTDLIVVEDIIGSHFWDIKLSRCLPQNYTYKDEVVNFKKYNPINGYKLFDYNDIDINFLKNDIPYNGKYYSIAFLVANYEKIIDSENITYYHSENDQTYPITTILYPIMFDENGNAVFLSDDTSYLVKNYGETEYKNVISGFRGLVSQPQNKKPYAFFFWADITKYVGDVIISDGVVPGTINVNISFSSDLSIKVFTDAEAGAINYLTISKNNTCPLYNEIYFPIIDRKLCIEEYAKVKLMFDEEEYEIPLKTLPVYDNSFYIEYHQSLIPPFNKTIIFKPYSSKEIIRYTKRNWISFTPKSNFVNFDDSFAEWFRNNYNSAITGVKNTQRQAVVDIVKQGVKTFFDIPSRIFSGFASNGFMGAAAGAVSATSDALANTTNTALQSITNVTKAVSSFKAKMQDAENATDNITFDGTLAFAIFNKKYLRVIRAVNANIKAIRSYHKCYGFDCGVLFETEDIQSHTVFDYLQATDITFKNEISFNEEDMISIETAINNGIRIWYSLENYKNFEVDNPEI